MDSRIKNYALLLLYLCLFLSACFPSKNLLKDKEKAKGELTLERDSSYNVSDKKVNVLLKELTKQNAKYTWVVAKGRAQYAANNQEFNFSLQLRQEKDKLSWLSLKKASIEGARIKVTPDSLQFINYQENEYTIVPFSYLNTQYNLPFTFEQFQTLFLGAPLIHEAINWEKVVYEKAQKYYLQGQYHQAQLEIILQQENNFMQEQILSIGNFSTHIAYGNYTYIAAINMHIPLQIELTFLERGQAPVVLFIHYNEISFQAPNNVRFEIPEHYKFVEMPRF